MEATPSRKIVLTGGGTAGHVMPHIAIIPLLKHFGYSITYIGSKGIEKNLISKTDLPFYEIKVGKLRRYFSWENLIDIFKVLIGTIQAFVLLAKIRPQVVFSKGGFVSVPVSVAAWVLKIPVVTHESDLTPGLANRIILRFSSKLLYSFPETAKYLPQDRSQLVGLPVRSELGTGRRDFGLEYCGFDLQEDLPTLLFMGGSLGAQRINQALEKALPELVSRYRVIHIAGKGKKLSFVHPRYVSFEFVDDELKDLFALADIVVSRAGANSIFEFLKIKKPMLLIPLEIGSRGDQVDNAICFEKHGFAKVLREKDLTPEVLVQAIEEVMINKSTLIGKQIESSLSEDAEGKVLTILNSYATRKCK